jgi:uncharacterized damage-inducible protein DinB
MYPIGPYTPPEKLEIETMKSKAEELVNFPEELKSVILNFSQNQLLTKTLPGVWTVAQVIHHLADSHMNAFIRTKLALTEDVPVIKPYLEEKWAELADGKSSNVIESIKILEGIHNRWYSLLISLDETEIRREYFHPENQKKVQLAEIVPLYVWHGRHHLGHIKLLKKDKGWT